MDSKTHPNKRSKQYERSNQPVLLANKKGSNQAAKTFEEDAKTKYNNIILTTLPLMDLGMI